MSDTEKRAHEAQEKRFLAALSRLMAVAEPADLAVIVESANAAVLAEREACAAEIVRLRAICTDNTPQDNARAEALTEALNWIRARK